MPRAEASAPPAEALASTSPPTVGWHPVLGYQPPAAQAPGYQAEAALLMAEPVVAESEPVVVQGEAVPAEPAAPETPAIFLNTHQAQISRWHARQSSWWYIGAVCAIYRSWVHFRGPAAWVLWSRFASLVGTATGFGVAGCMLCTASARKREAERAALQRLVRETRATFHDGQYVLVLAGRWKLGQIIRIKDDGVIDFALQDGIIDQSLPAWSMEPVSIDLPTGIKTYPIDQNATRIHMLSAEDELATVDCVTRALETDHQRKENARRRQREHEEQLREREREREREQRRQQEEQLRERERELQEEQRERERVRGQRRREHEEERERERRPNCPNCGDRLHVSGPDSDGDYRCHFGSCRFYFNRYGQPTVGPPDRQRAFLPGQRVRYFSSSYGGWIPAKVLRHHRDDSVTLDVRAHADIDRIRPR
jgi:hypothetical protein